VRSVSRQIDEIGFEAHTTHIKEIKDREQELAQRELEYAKVRF
jgi:hypothetical protein